MAINIKNQWGISEGQGKAKSNSCKFISKFEDLSGTGPFNLRLPSGTYEFNMMYLGGNVVDNVNFYGDTDSNGNPTTTIKFVSLPGIREKQCQQSPKIWNPSHCFLKVWNIDNFSVTDLAVNGIDANDDGGVWAADGATNGLIKNIRVR